MKKFCFDLDGTIFKGESLPHIAKTNGLWEEYQRVANSSGIDSFTPGGVDDNTVWNRNYDDADDYKAESTLRECEIKENNREESANKKNEEQDKVDKKSIASIERYKETLLKRIAVLQKVPVRKSVEDIAKFEVNEKIVEFINQHKDQCAVITSNLDCWVGCFLGSLGCEYHTSKAVVKDGYITAMDNILDKKSVVNQYKAQGYEVVYIGDGLNDIDAMEVADVSIAFLASENSWKRLGELCDYCCFNQEELIKLLREWS